jgi:putative alpha-1,2-mannosidase
VAGSLLSMTAQGSMGMPRWPFASLYTEDMVGRHGVPLLADCVLTTGACGGRVSVAAAAAAATAAVTAQDALIPPYATPAGYVPVGGGSASETLEYCVDDFAAAALAAAAGDAPAAALLASRTGNWASVFSAAVPAVLPRLPNGTFVDVPGIWAPHPFNSYYTEGSAAQWTWHVPHNMSGLAATFPGGADGFAAGLQMILANQTYWNTVLSTFLPNPYCWLGASISPCVVVRAAAARRLPPACSPYSTRLPAPDHSPPRR